MLEIIYSFPYADAAWDSLYGYRGMLCIKTLLPWLVKYMLSISKSVNTPMPRIHQVGQWVVIENAENSVYNIL